MNIKKKFSFALAALFFIAAIVYVPAVKSFAVSALSVFRVEEAKTIKVTLADMEEMATWFRQHENKADQHKALLEKHIGKHPALDDPTCEPTFRELDSVKEFKEFSFHLPKKLAGEQPDLWAMDPYSFSHALDVAMINEHLSLVGLPALDQGYDGATIKVDFPGVIAAQYSEVSLLATQGVALDAPDELLYGLWANVLALPFLSENLRGQLAEIDIKSRDVYLPVVLGIGREVAVGNGVGYLYSTKDLGQLNPILTELRNGEADVAVLNHFETNESNLLIWTNNGVLYVLCGQVPESEIIDLARSVR
jgi:hypothetical protein